MAKKSTEKKERKPRGKAGIWITDDGLLLIAAWVRDGATDEILAKKMQISRSTLSEWKIKHPEFAEAVRKSKEIVDIEVENGLLRRATGYTYIKEVPIKLKTEFWVDGKKCSKEEIEIVEITEIVPPDPKAAQYWLNNRKPDSWKATREEDAGDDNVLEIVIPEKDKGQFE